MNIPPEALSVMASCISRGEHLTIESLPATEVGLRCTTCQALAVTVTPLRGISEDAVYDLGSVAVCTVCTVPLCDCGHNVPDHEHGPCEECNCEEYH